MIPYATLDRLKQHRNITSEKAIDDAFLVWLLQSASEIIHRQTCRHFTPYQETKRVGIESSYDNTRLRAPDDVQSLATVINGNGSSVTAWDIVGLAWVDVDAGWEYPSIRSRVTLTGIWGYHDQPDQMWAQSETLTDDLDEIETQITVNSNYSVADMLKIGDEFLYVEAFNTEDGIITVQREANGTSPESHTTSDIIYKYKQSPGVEWACVEMAAWLYKNRDRVNEYVQFAEGGGVRIGDMSRDLVKFVKKYSRCKCDGC